VTPVIEGELLNAKILRHNDVFLETKSLSPALSLRGEVPEKPVALLEKAETYLAKMDCR